MSAYPLSLPISALAQSSFALQWWYASDMHHKFNDFQLINYNFIHKKTATSPTKLLSFYSVINLLSVYFFFDFLVLVLAVDFFFEDFFLEEAFFFDFDFFLADDFL